VVRQGPARIQLPPWNTSSQAERSSMKSDPTTLLWRNKGRGETSFKYLGQLEMFSSTPEVQIYTLLYASHPPVTSKRDVPSHEATNIPEHEVPVRRQGQEKNHRVDIDREVRFYRNDLCEMG